MARRVGWVLALALSALLGLLGQVSAAVPEARTVEQGGGQRVGLSSTWVDCVSVRAGASRAVSATVRLEWQGRVDEAHLVFTGLGSQGGHSIYVNGRFVGRAPVRGGDRTCAPGSRTLLAPPADSLRIPVEVLAKGENVVTLTNDADPSDGWTAANLRIEIHGVISGPPVAALEAPAPAAADARVQAVTVISSSVALTSSYELAQGQTITQVAYYQIPTGYIEGISTPLVIGVHGYGDTGRGMLDTLAAEANNRGWLLASPDMHGNYFKNHGRYALGWIGAQHDIVDTIEFMVANYSVDKSRIYVIGASMGGQIATLMDAKYPDVFAATVEWSGITDLASWYGTLYNLGLTSSPWIPNIRREIDPGCNPVTDPLTGCGSPAAKPFEYQRRSSVLMPQNSRLVPLKIWHALQDQLVPITHSRNLRNAINAWNPPTPVTLIEVDCQTYDCGSFYNHEYNPPMQDMFDHFVGRVLSAQAPLSVSVRTDESKSYHWLNVAQTGSAHWSDVSAAYDPALRKVTVLISDTQPLTLGLNIGATSIVGPGGIARSGLGLPAGVYSVTGGGNNYLVDYGMGYLTVTLNTTGQFTLVVSAAESRIYLPVVMRDE